MRTGPSIVGLVVLALAFAGCGPTPPPPPDPGTPTACIELEVARCRQALQAMPEDLLADGDPAYIAIAEWPCDGPCNGAWFAQMTIEFDGNHPPATFRLGGGPAGIDWQPVESVMVLVGPASVELEGDTIDLTLGHCGLASGIDVDGAYWDPVGAIDTSHGDLINSAEARFTLVSPNEAILRTSGGAVVQLVRHQAPKYLFLCD